LRSTIFTTAASALLAALLAYGCGGVSGGGIGGTGIAQGVVANSGGGNGITVGGIDFNVDSASITINGTPATPNDLKPGMVVTVNGTIDDSSGTGIADEVRFESLVRGPVQNVDAAQGILVVFGQPLFVTTGTVFEGTSLATLQLGTVLEVSGLTNTGGDVTATRVLAVTQAGGFVLRGLVRNLDTVARTFQIRRVLVDFSRATTLGAPAGGLADGQLVRIATTGLVGGLLVADTVEIRGSDIDFVVGLLLRVEGFITQVVNGSVFVLNDRIAVRINADTLVAGGSGARDLQPDARIVVEGRINSNLRLVAQRIEIRTAAGLLPLGR